MRNKTLISLARKLLKEAIAQCTIGQQNLFKKMYPYKDSIETNDIFLFVDKMDSDSLDRAITQVENTITENKRKNDK